MSSAFVSKSRRVRFELTLRIIDLNNVPLVSGTSFVKWHLPHSIAAEHRGKTNKCAIKDHRVDYSYEKQTQVRLVVGRDQMLQECNIDFECLQEYSAGGRGERIILGTLSLNLAEYADAAELHSPGGGGTGTHDADEGIIRRYLMKDSKINSTLKLGISMRHVEGTRDYSAAALKTQPVFGGIAGIISSSEPAPSPHAAAAHANGDHADGPQELPMPSFSTTSKEIGEMQDMYRRTLAAYWASQPGELKADECIEDIFSGGDGWGKSGRPHGQSPPRSGASTPNLDADVPSRHGSIASKEEFGVPGGRGHNFSRHHHKRRFRALPGELDEMEVREDLVSWHIGKRDHVDDDDL